MEYHLPESCVEGYEAIEDRFSLPDENDKHVLAAAIKSGASLLLTENTRDFPKETLCRYKVAPVNVDEFFESLLRSFPQECMRSVREVIGSLENPPVSLKQYCSSFEQKGFEGLSRSLLSLFNHTQ